MSASLRMPQQSVAAEHLKYESVHSSRPDSSRNRLLTLLSANALSAVMDRAERVTIASREPIWNPGQEISHVYFPEDGVISLVTKMRDGSGVEAMTIGNDGFAGLAIFHGISSTTSLACGQISGTSLRLTTDDFRDVLARTPELATLLHRYSQYIFEVVSQAAACNRLHVVEQRCARWLLMSEDRVGRSRFDLTQEFLAEMLGVRRPGVTVTMGILEKRGLISHGRGHITVVDRPGLELAACECYQVVRAEHARIVA